MAEGIKLPGLGEVDKKYVIGGVVIAVGIVAVVAVRKHSANSQAAAASSTPATDTTGTDSGIDPTTGLPYSEEQSGAYDTSLASGLESGGISTGYGAYPNGSGYDAAGYPLGSEADLQWQAQQSGTTTGTASITTNTDWVSAALTQLPGSESTNDNALTRVLGGLTVKQSQKNIFEEAVGLLGEGPPQGYPQPIKVSDTAAQPGGGKKHTITANGNQDLSEIAHANHTTGGNLVRANITLAQYYGNKKKVKRGTRIVIP